MHLFRAAQLATSLTGAIVANTKTPRAGRYAFRVETVAPAPQAKLVLAGDTQAETDEWIAVLQLAGANSTYDGNKTSRRGSSLSTAVRAISSSMSGHEEQQAMLGNSMRSDAAPPPPPTTNGALKIDMAAAARMATPALKKTPSRIGGPLVVTIGKMMGDLGVWLVLYLSALLAFSVVFKALFAAAATQPQFATVIESSVWLFYAAFGAFEPSALEGPAEATGQAALIAWLFVSTLMLINLLIALFADSYANTKNAAKTIFKFKAAQLKYEFINMRGLPPPLNLVTLPLGLVGGGAGACLRGLTCAPKGRGGGGEGIPSISDAWLAVVKTVRAKRAKAADDDEGMQAVEASLRKVNERLDVMGKAIEKLAKAAPAEAPKRSMFGTGRIAEEPEEDGDDDDDDDDDDAFADSDDEDDDDRY